MKPNNESLITNHIRAQRGGMMLELLLTIALVAIMLPFIFKFQQTRVKRSENMAVISQMEQVRNALEKYIDANRTILMQPIGRNITRVKMAQLEQFGLDTEIIKNHGADFQLRVLKSAARSGHASIQGIVVMNDKEFSNMRTHEIVGLGDGQMGFVDGASVHGGHGTWRARVSDFGLSGTDGIATTTHNKIANSEYLWRLPSENASDSAMRSNLNLGGNNITGAKFFDVQSVRFAENLRTEILVADKLSFQTMVNIDGVFHANNVTVSGGMAADSRNLEIKGTLNLADSAKLTNFVTDDFRVQNLNLSGMSGTSVDDTNPTILKIDKVIDMLSGHINAIYVGVSYTGSVTPRLVVKNRIEDSRDSQYFWDTRENTANMSDITLANLNAMAPKILRRETASGTHAARIFNSVTSNQNATAGDFMNAISEIAATVRAKHKTVSGTSD